MVPPEIVDAYTKILEEYLKESTEQNLFNAYGFSRGCVEREIGPEEVLGIHMEAIDRLMKIRTLPPSHLVISHNLLLEAMMAYGIFYRESLELQKRYVEELKQKNAECREIRVQVEGLNAQLEERVQEKMKELQQAQEQIYRMEKLTSLGQLISGVAHEINNPLTGVLGFSEILKERTDLSPQVRGDLEKIYQEGSRARRIIQNLLSFARQHKPARSFQNLNELLENTLAIKSYEHGINNIRVELTLDPGLPWTMVDPSQIQQVFLNILHNAEEAMLESKGAGSLRVRTESLSVESLLRITFENDGPAIPLELLPKVFDPFFTTKEVGKGTGLGLSVAYGILREHGGSIRVENTDHGAVFVLDLPVVRGTAVAEDVMAEQGNLKDKRVLVVEDEPVLADLIREVLKGEGCRVTVAEDGIQATRRLEGGVYDLILTDVRMPGLGGIGLYHHIRERKPEMARQMIFITGDTVNPQTMSFLLEEGHRFIEKPFHISKFLKVLREALVP